jgi:hypothetical protein
MIARTRSAGSGAALPGSGPAIRITRLSAPPNVLASAFISASVIVGRYLSVSSFSSVRPIMSSPSKKLRVSSSV